MFVPKVFHIFIVSFTFSVQRDHLAAALVCKISLLGVEIETQLEEWGIPKTLQRVDF